MEWLLVAVLAVLLGLGDLVFLCVLAVTAFFAVKFLLVGGAVAIFLTPADLLGGIVALAPFAWFIHKTIRAFLEGLRGE